MPEKPTASLSRDRARTTELQPRYAQWRSPFGLWQRFADEMDRVFEDAGFGGWTMPRVASVEGWVPQIEMFQRGTELVIRADVPGLTKDDIKVDVQDDALTIHGERKREHEEEREGIYRSERSYGSFIRTIPLPQGAIADQAKAEFKNGVLEIVIPAPPEQVSRGRRLEIKEGSDAARK
jgi:HSP20 family protein